MKSKKTARRAAVLEGIFSTLTSKDIYDTIHYKRMDEGRIKQYLHRPLQDMVCKLCSELGGYKPDTAKQITRKSLRWEGDKQTTVNNFVLFGVQHRPDFDLTLLDTSYAIEIKRGENGSDVRGGIGQALVYTTRYDFCAYLFIDTSPDKKIANAFTSDREQQFIKELWEHHNIMFRVV